MHLGIDLAKVVWLRVNLLVASNGVGWRQVELIRVEQNLVAQEIESGKGK